MSISASCIGCCAGTTQGIYRQTHLRRAVSRSRVPRMLRCDKLWCSRWQPASQNFRGSCSRCSSSVHLRTARRRLCLQCRPRLLPLAQRTTRRVPRVQDLLTELGEALVMQEL
eukprot:Rmarinus@m.2285